MYKALKERHKGIILKTVLVFLASYLVFLIFWIQVKDYYGYAVIAIASKVVMFIKDVSFEGMAREEGIIQATFSPLQRKPDILIDIPVNTSSYTFNAPLTLAIMAALSLFIKSKRRAYGEALLILLTVHLLYVFSLEAKELTEVLIDRRLEAAGKPSVVLYQFLWSFTDNMVIRFEPFLIGFYMFIRFKA
jgi:hypothetical protein